MARLTVNEAGMTGYTDEIILTPGDFTTAAGNSTTVVSIPVKEGDVIDGAALKVVDTFSTASRTFKIGTDSNTGVNDDDGLIVAVRVDQSNIAANTGARLSIAGDDSAASDTARVVCTGDGNIDITASGDMSGDTSGKVRVLLSIKRIG